jgi:archaellum biogenesis ATPase FlaH
MGERIVRVLQVMKLKGAEKSGLSLAFEVDAAYGIRVLPFSQAKA